MSPFGALEQPYTAMLSIRPLSRSVALALAFALAACSSGSTDSSNAEGGASNGGASNGGSANGGASNGGASNGGASNGGSANGGSANGGASNGGASNGGSASAGNANGGAMNGGASNGGAANGGAANGGFASGGKSNGGAANGGAPNGGAANGGKASGGAANGGAMNGGAPNGGSAGSAGSSAYRPCPSSGPCKIMPFGDSITDGFGTAGSYRVELFRLAHQAGKNITFVGSGSNGPATVDGVNFPPNHEGHSGFTIAPTPSRSGISPLVATVMPQFTPHIVTLMIGTNDAIDNYEMPNAPTRLGALIDSIFAQLPNVLLVVAEPIPSQDDALNGRLQTYNAAIPAVVKARADAGKHILLVDMYTPFAANSAYKTALLKDTWHPNEAGDVILGARFYAVLAPSL